MKSKLNILLENQLALWMEEQQEAYKQGKLSKKQIELLESLPKWKWTQ